MADFGANIRRLLAREGMTVEQLVQRSGLDERSIKWIMSGKTQPRAKSLHAIAAALEVNADELFVSETFLGRRTFDQATNPIITETIDEDPQLVADWSPAELDELYSNQGHGGALTREGVLELVKRINRKRAVRQKVEVLMESDRLELLEALIEVLWKEVQVTK